MVVCVTALRRTPRPNRVPDAKHPSLEWRVHPRNPPSFVKGTSVWGWCFRRLVALGFFGVVGEVGGDADEVVGGGGLGGGDGAFDGVPGGVALGVVAGGPGGGQGGGDACGGGLVGRF